VAEAVRLPLGRVLREWGRIGVVGFGGPPAHIALLRERVVDRYGWMAPEAFEDANAACQLLPGPASTQLAIFCAYRLAGRRGAVVGGLAFVVPAVLLVLALSVLFLEDDPPTWVLGAGAGAGAAVAAVAVRAGWDLLVPSRERAREGGRLVRWSVYLVLGGVAAATIGPWLVLVLLACGLVELARRSSVVMGAGPVALLAAAAVTTGGTGALAWTAFKVGALSYGGGFVIIPLMQQDAVDVHHWMTGGQFLNAVALGQVTPGPVVATVAAVGYAASGVAGALLASLIAFAPSFLMVLLGGERFDRLREDARARAFLDGAGPAAIGAILGAAVPLAGALSETWQLAVLAGAAVLLLVVRRGPLLTLLGGGVVGVVLAVAGAPLPG
jgi:chromate transporter